MDAKVYSIEELLDMAKKESHGFDKCIIILFESNKNHLARYSSPFSLSQFLGVLELSKFNEVMSAFYLDKDRLGNKAKK